MDNRRDTSFLIGGRYRNRIGEYEVLDINDDYLRVRYDDGREDNLDARVQARIIQNMRLETQRISPYPSEDADNKNHTFFQSLGFLAKRVTMLEAIVHPRAQAGFVETYRSIVGRSPSVGQDGYYVHEPEADKWGNELRVTFDASGEEIEELDLGPDVEIVVNPSAYGYSWRINRNAFWWYLLRLGFKMGHAQDIQLIRAKIPHSYLNDFDEGIRIAE